MSEIQSLKNLKFVPKFGHANSCTMVRHFGGNHCQEDFMHAKLPKLALNQETIRNLTRAQKGNALCPTFQASTCNTQYLSCPECNPPQTTGV